MNHRAILLIAAGLAWCGLALAQAPAAVRYNVVELTAEIQREVGNDLLTAQVFVEDTNANSAALAASINRSLAEALKIARDFPAVKVRAGSNQTFPVYAPRTNQMQGWRARAEVRIEARDFAAATALIGRLQSFMQLAGMNFSVAPETRRAVENELIAEAIGAFRVRAEIARKALDGKGYKVQRIAVNAGYSGPPPRLMLAQSRAAMADATVAAPPAEGGSSIVSVTATGAVEIE